MLTEHEMAIRVRYSETDGMGLLHHANYAVYFEMGRTELFRAQGGSYRDLEQQGLYLVVVELNCKYHAPARYDDLLRLHTIFSRKTPAKLEHTYQLFREEALLASARSVLACLDRDGRIRRIPETIIAPQNR